jgi:O-acetyl-ADP-ribose deacetylase (regulator of RNase III)
LKKLRIAVGVVKEFLEKEDKLERIIFVLFSDRDFEIYLKAAKT